MEPEIPGSTIAVIAIMAAKKQIQAQTCCHMLKVYRNTISICRVKIRDAEYQCHTDQGKHKAACLSFYTGPLFFLLPMG